MNKAWIRTIMVLLILLAAGQAAGKALALAAPVTITPDAGEKSGDPGTTVTFNLAVQAAEDGQYVLTTSSPWSVTVTPNQFDLSAGELASAQLDVVIPPGARSGQSADVTISAQRGGSEVFSTRVTVSAVQASSARPLVVIDSYYLDKDTVRPGDEFRLFLSARNNGSLPASNLIFSFASEGFIAQETGGVVSLGDLAAGGSEDISQKMSAGGSLWGQTSGAVAVKLTYTGPTGEAYTESFTVNVPVLGWSGSWSTATPTATGTVLPRAQIVVSSYRTDTDPLQPGTVFNLEMDIQNLGGGDAKNVSLAIGGGSNNPSSGGEGTPEPGGGGISSSGADFSVFAPLGSANIQFFGDISAGQSLTARQQLIVNVSANPGAYTLKLSFIYTDMRGYRQVDDQIITLLVYQLPQVEVNFYRDPGPISAMQPNTIPVQVVNLGRKPAVMGNMKVAAENADVTNNVSLVGNLEAGGYFPLDVMLIPHAAGPLDLKVEISYTDDFNQPRKIEQSLNLIVMEGAPVIEPGGALGPDGMPIEPGMGGDGGEFMPPVVEETTWDKVLRFIKGFLGLDSAVPQPEVPTFPEGMPPEGVPQEGNPMPAPAVPGRKG